MSREGVNTGSGRYFFDFPLIVKNGKGIEEPQEVKEKSKCFFMFMNSGFLLKGSWLKRLPDHKNDEHSRLVQAL